MTLIVAALTKKKGFLFGDQTRTILPQEGKQVQIKMDKIKIILHTRRYKKNKQE